MKKAIVAILTAGCLVLIALQGCDQTGKKVSIRFKYRPGMRLTYEQVSKGTVQAFVNDSLTRDRHNKVTLTLLLSVRRLLEDSTAEVIDSMSWRVESRDKSDSLIVDTVHHGEPIVSYVRPNGKLVDIEMGSDKDKPKLSYLKSYYEQCLPVFPEGDLSQGYSWTQTTRVIPPEGPMEVSTTYEIRSFARERGYDCVVVAYDGNVLIPLEPRKVEEDGFTEILSGVDRITVKGHLYFAYKEGIIVKQQERWELDGDREAIRCKGDTANVKVEMESDISFSLLKIDNN